MSRTPPAKRRAEDNDAGPAKRIFKCDNYRCSNGKNPVTAELGSPGGVDSALLSGNRADIITALWDRGTFDERSAKRDDITLTLWDIWVLLAKELGS